MPISYFIWGKYHTRSFILVFLAHFVLCSFSLRADPFFYFDYIDDTYGLTNSSIEAIAQDKDGYMWFGTQEGIFQFDGLQSVKYYQDNKQGSLLDDDIFDLLITEENELWVATSSAGIARFDRKSETFTHITDTTYPLKISHYRVTTIIEVDDKIWLHTQKGIETINKYDLQIENIPLIYESNELAEYDSSSLVYFNESVWTVYKGKLFRTSQDGNRFIEYEFTEKNNDLNSNEIFRIYATKMRMILHMKGGLYELNKTEPLGLTILDTKIVIDNNVKIQSVIEDDYGTVWMTIYGEGLFFKIKGNMEFNHVHSGIARNQLNTKAVIAIYQDDSNNIWLGTDGNFLVKFRSPFKLFPFTTNLYSPDENLQTHGIWSILEFNEDFYIGTENGVFKYKESEALLSPVLVKNQYKLAYKLLVNNEKLLIGTASGLYQLHETGVITDLTYILTNNLNNIFDIETSVLDMAISDKYLYIGTFYGLIVVDKKTFEAVNVFNSESEINALNDNWIVAMEYNARENTLWLGYPRGGQVISFSDDNKELTNNSLLNNKLMSRLSFAINDFYFDKEGHAWIATERGLYRVTSEKILVEYSEFPDNNILSIEEANGYFWLSTTNGLLKASKKDLSTFDYFVKEDGVFNSINIQKSSYHDVENSRLYFGGDKGFNVFDSDIEIPILNNITPRMRSVKLLNVSGEPNLLRKIKSGTKLSYNENSLRFGFSYMDFKSPRSNRFQYQLSGFDKSWSEKTNENNVSYTNLNSGQYEFKLRAFNANQLQSPTEISLIFSISPPFWKSQLAYLLYFASFITFFGYIYFYAQNRQKRKSIAIVQKNKEAFINNYNKYATDLTKLNSYQTIVRKFLDQLCFISGCDYLRYQQQLNGTSFEISVGVLQDIDRILHKKELISQTTLAQLFIQKRDVKLLSAIESDIDMLFLQMVSMQQAIIDKQRYNWNDYFNSVTGLHNTEAFIQILRDEIERAEIVGADIKLLEFAIDRNQFRGNNLLKRIQLLGFGDQIKYIFGHHVVATYVEKSRKNDKFIVYLGEVGSEMLSKYTKSLLTLLSEADLTKNTNLQVKQSVEILSVSGIYLDSLTK